MIILRFNNKQDIETVYSIYKKIQDTLPEEKVIVIPEDISYIGADLPYLEFLLSEIQNAILDYKEKAED